MIRRLMASTAMLALITAGAFSAANAQTQPDAEQPAAAEQPATGVDPAAAPAVEQEEPAQPIAADAPTLTPDEPTIATAFIGRSVFSSEEPESDNIGEVNDLIIGSDGMITHAVVGVGGFLGIGEKDVSVPFDQLQVVQDSDGDVRLIYAATKEQLEQAEAFDRTVYDPEEREEEAQEQAAEVEAEAEADVAAAGSNAVGTAAGVAAGAGAAIGTGVATTTDAVTDATENAADAVTDGDHATAGTDAAPATPAQPMQTSEADAAADQQQMAAGNASPMSGEAQFVSYGSDQIRASDIIGGELYGAENETIGEVSDLVLQPEGETRVAVVDVGGFLGIGEKRVAIPFGDIEFMQDATAAQDMTAQPAPAATQDPAAQTDPVVAPQDPAVTADPALQTDTAAGTQAGAQPDMGAQGEAPEPRMMVNMTREQLEQAPEWQDTTEATVDPTVTDPNAPASATDQQMAAGTDPNAPAATGGEVAAGTDPNAPATTDDRMAAGTDPNAVTTPQYQTATQDISADDLLGSAIFNPNEESLGEVGDVVFDTSGSIQAVVVDVGGFLGIGEKPVAVQFDALNVQKGTSGDVRLMVNTTQEQLESAPAYNENENVEGQAAPVQ